MAQLVNLKLLWSEKQWAIGSILSQVFGEFSFLMLILRWLKDTCYSYWRYAKALIRISKACLHPFLDSPLCLKLFITSYFTIRGRCEWIYYWMNKSGELKAQILHDKHGENLQGSSSWVMNGLPLFFHYKKQWNS